MGKSDKVKQLQQTDQNFSTMMKTMEDSMASAVKEKDEKFEQEITDFYTSSGYTPQLMEQGEHYDYQMQIEFSTKNITDVIQKTAEEVFGAAGKDDDQQKIVLALQNYYNFALSAATNVLCDALSLLAWKQSADYEINMQHVSVGPGLTMHLMIVCRSFSGETSTDNKQVLQSFIKYKIIFSREKGRAEMEQMWIAAQMESFQSDSETCKQLSAVRNQLVLSKELYQETDVNGPLHTQLHTLEECINELKASRQAAYEAVCKLDQGSRTDALDQRPDAPLRAYLYGGNQ